MSYYIDPFTGRPVGTPPPAHPKPEALPLFTRTEVVVDWRGIAAWVKDRGPTRFVLPDLESYNTARASLRRFGAELIQAPGKRYPKGYQGDRVYLISPSKELKA